MLSSGERAKLSSWKARLVSVRVTARGSGSAIVGDAGISPKYCSIHSLVCTTSKSPATTSVALLGPYQVRKNSRMSSMVAFARSSNEPMTVQLYGWSSG